MSKQHHEQPVTQASAAKSKFPTGSVCLTTGAEAPRKYRLLRVLAVELVFNIIWMPAVIICGVLIFTGHLLFPLLAEASRSLSRWCGGVAPSQRPEGIKMWQWLGGRAFSADFWRQDLPLMLGVLLLGFVEILVFAWGLSVTVSFIALPFMASSSHPIQISLGGWFDSLAATSPGQVWWSPLVGILAAGLTVVLLLGFGWLRQAMNQALSHEDEAGRIEALTAEVGHLAAGRATLLDAFDAERARIERDLHDGAQQELVALAINLGGLRLRAERLPGDGPGASERAEILAGLDASQDRAEAALRRLRETVHGIQPVVLTERGLAAALQELAGRAPLPTVVLITGEDADLAAITSPVATAIYFAVSEALTNAAKHAGENARAVVTLEVNPQMVRAVVSDNGVGGADLTATGSTGLAGMAQRLESIGGSLLIDSAAGSGTVLRLSAPLMPPWAKA